jgi:hypothetical protein
MENLMEKNRISIYILLIALSFIGCKSKNSLELSKKVIDNICYEVNILPKEFLEKNDTIKMADLLYIKFTVYEEKNNMRIQEVFKQANYNSLLYYINTKISDDFKIVQDSKEISPVQVHFENNNRIANKLVFLIAFEKPIINKDILLTFNDNIFNNGIIKLKLNSI